MLQPLLLIWFGIVKLHLKLLFVCRPFFRITVFPFTQTDSAGLAEVALGGAFYVSGVVFFKCDGRIPFAHAIWHCFCATGAWCHFYAVYTHLYLEKH